MFETEAGVLDEPILWISDTTPDPAIWGFLRSQHPHTGLWPLLLEGHHAEPDRPWTSGELDPDLIESDPSDHDPNQLLAGWWSDYTALEEGDWLTDAERIAVTAPFEDRWPGLAPPGQLQQDPDALAAEFAEELVTFPWFDPASRLGLSVSERSADAPAALGWSGPVNYDNDTAKFCAILRSWEDRFGVRVVAMGFATLHLSVAAPPAELDHALHVAAEHFAFCPDNVWQSGIATLTRYAEKLINRPWWSFWWD